MEGATSFTVSVTELDPLPPALVAVTEYAAAEPTAVGVPEISQVDASSAIPAGSAGETEQ